MHTNRNVYTFCKAVKILYTNVNWEKQRYFKRWYETHDSCQLEYEIRIKKECELCKRSFISICILNKAKRIKKLCHPHVIRFLYTYSLFRIWNESVSSTIRICEKKNRKGNFDTKDDFPEWIGEQFLCIIMNFKVSH